MVELNCANKGEWKLSQDLNKDVFPSYQRDWKLWKVWFLKLSVKLCFKFQGITETERTRRRDSNYFTTKITFIAWLLEVVLKIKTVFYLSLLSLSSLWLSALSLSSLVLSNLLLSLSPRRRDGGKNKWDILFRPQELSSFSHPSLDLPGWVHYTDL